CTLDWQLLPATHDAACHARKSHYGCSAMGPSSDGRKGRYGALTVTRRKDATPSVVSGVRGKVFPLASARCAVFGSPLSPRSFTPKTPGVRSLTHPHPLPTTVRERPMVRQPVRAAEHCERVAQCLQAPFAGPAATVPHG